MDVSRSRLSCARICLLSLHAPVRSGASSGTERGQRTRRHLPHALLRRQIFPLSKRMVPREHGEESIMADGHGKEEEVGVMRIGGADGDEEDAQHGGGKFSVSSFLWHGGSFWDAWFSCASNQVAQVLLTLPYSFSQLGMLSGILLHIFYGFLGSWTAYLISVLYVEYCSRKEKEGVSFKNHGSRSLDILSGN